MLNEVDRILTDIKIINDDLELITNSNFTHTPIDSTELLNSELEESLEKSEQIRFQIETLQRVEPEKHPWEEFAPQTGCCFVKIKYSQMIDGMWNVQDGILVREELSRKIINYKILFNPENFRRIDVYEDENGDKVCVGSIKLKDIVGVPEEDGVYY